MIIGSIDKLNFVGVVQRIYLIYVFVRVAFHQVLLLPDGAGRTLFVLNIFFLINFIINRKFFFINISKISTIWLFWCIYAFLNTLIQGFTFNMDVWQFFNYLFTPFISLVLSHNVFSNSKSPSFVFYLSIAVIVQLIIFFFFTSTTNYTDGDRLGDDLINSNTIAQNATLGIIVISITGYFKLLSRSLVFILILCSFIIVLSTGSRLGFVISVLNMFFTIFLFSKNKYISRPFLILFLVILSLFAFLQFSSELLVLERLKTTKEEGDEIVKTGTALDYLGGRGVYYLYGFEIFMNNPYFGVGLNNYRKFNPISNQPNHVEYMIQLSELGIIGGLLFVIFFTLVLIKLRNSSSKDKLFKFFCILSIWSMLLMGGSYWLHNEQIVFIVIGILLGILSNKNQIYLRNPKR